MRQIDQLSTSMWVIRTSSIEQIRVDVPVVRDTKYIWTKYQQRERISEGLEKEIKCTYLLRDRSCSVRHLYAHVSLRLWAYWDMVKFLTLQRRFSLGGTKTSSDKCRCRVKSRHVTVSALKSRPSWAFYLLFLYTYNTSPPWLMCKMLRKLILDR